MKDRAKKTILASGALRLAATAQGPSAAILMYHSVMPDPTALADILGGIAHSEHEFRAQMELLSRDYHPASLADVVKNLRSTQPLQKRTVVVTFDDGYSDNHEVAMPILNRLGIPATFYVTVDCVENRTLPWPSRLRFAFRNTTLTAWVDSHARSWTLADLPSRERVFLATCDECCQLRGQPQEEFVQRIERELKTRVPGESGSLMMNYDQVRGLARHGHIVGSHTVTHPNMAYVKASEASAEFTESKQRLEKELNLPVVHFAYPCPALSPHWNERTVEQSRAAGYESGVTTISGLTRRGDNPLSLKRMRPTKTAEGLRWNLESAFAGRAV
ncbi:MAG TPA: polysaccharide deacetylase family protein [Candidatus Dormibacteraeota bacterium]|nr:polysaccharide deacetylase family protein [Candidatus Dormibacteraeota bacterium]